MKSCAWIIDDHKLFGGGMRRLVLSLNSITDALCFTNPEEALTHGRSGFGENAPALIVTDLYVPGHDMKEWIKTVKELFPNVPCAVITSSISRTDREACLDAGADAYFEKHQDPEIVLENLGRLMECDKADNNTAMSNLAPAPQDIDGHRLTERQVDILVLLARGYSAKEIARQLSISYETVKSHLSNIYQELGVSGRSAASDWARHHGFV